MVSDNSSQNNFYYPVIEFETIDQRCLSVKYDIGGNYKAYREGDIVNVIYDPEDVTKFILDDYRSKIIGPLFLSVGIIMLLGSLIYYLMDR